MAVIVHDVSAKIHFYCHGDSRRDAHDTKTEDIAAGIGYKPEPVGGEATLRGGDPGATPHHPVHTGGNQPGTTISRGALVILMVNVFAPFPDIAI